MNPSKRWFRLRRANRFSVVDPTTKRPIGDPGTIVSNPPPLAVIYRARKLSRDPPSVKNDLRLFSVWLFSRPQYYFSQIPFIRFLIQAGAAITFIVTLYTFSKDIEVRREEAVARAWAIISAAKEDDVGNIGASRALEILVEHEVPLMDVRLPGATLREVSLSGAKMGRADFGNDCVNEVLLLRSELIDLYWNWWITMVGIDGSFREKLDECGSKPTDLVRATLTRSNLIHSNFFGATLVDADLSSTCLYSATFSGADISYAEFDGSILRNAKLVGSLLIETDFTDADLGNADFRGAICNIGTSEEPVFDICERERFGRMIANSQFVCGVKFPDGYVNDEQCEGIEFATVNCDERHGYVTSERDRKGFGERGADPYGDLGGA